MKAGYIPVYTNGKFAPADLLMYPRRGVTYSAFYSVLMGKVYCEILLAKIPHIKFIVLIYPEGGA